MVLHNTQNVNTQAGFTSSILELAADSLKLDTAVDGNVKTSDNFTVESNKLGWESITFAVAWAGWGKL